MGVIQQVSSTHTSLISVVVAWGSVLLSAEEMGQSCYSGLFLQLSYCPAVAHSDSWLLYHYRPGAAAAGLAGPYDYVIPLSYTIIKSSNYKSYTSPSYFWFCYLSTSPIWAHSEDFRLSESIGKYMFTASNWQVIARLKLMPPWQEIQCAILLAAAESGKMGNYLLRNTLKALH